MKKTLLITGINGFLGSHLAKGLNPQFEIIGIEYSLQQLERVSEENYRIYESDEKSLISVFENHDIHAVLHVATVYKKKDESLQRLISTNVILPIRLMELARDYKVKAFLNTDTFFNNPEYNYSYLREYTLSKRHSLDWLKAVSESTDCKIINMKLFHMYGENDASHKFIPYVIHSLKNNQEKLELTPGLQTRDFVYVRDVVKAFLFVLNNLSKMKSYENFEIGSGKVHTIKKLVVLLKELLNSETRLEFGALEYRSGEIMSSELKNVGLFDLGWRPEYSLREGLINCVKNV